MASEMIRCHSMSLVHAFVTSCIDYCNAIYAGRRRRLLTSCNECSMLPPVWSVTQKFDQGLTSLFHDELHWLDAPERVTCKMGVMVYRCLHSQAPRYLADHCDHFNTSSDIASRLRLRYANRHQLIVPRWRLNT